MNAYHFILIGFAVAVLCEAINRADATRKARRNAIGTRSHWEPAPTEKNGASA